MYNLEFKITGDCSHTLLVKELNETYHSTKGSINEARHVFIQKGLCDYVQKTGLKDITVFEVGFGTGLNAHLSQLFANENNVHINYIAVEVFPLEMEIIKQLNFTELIPSDQLQFLNLHEAAWNKPIVLDNNFTMTKLHQKLDDVSSLKEIDVIFFDAFAPDVQPEMWMKSVFEKMHDFLKIGGVLVTYCAKGVVKRTIKEVGFELETLEGPPGKREMIRSTKHEVGRL
ncbi:MAG: tRNA (5-methylaminomethyl-2-thiouridine)(34)-methyltransferase MnmD [Bacteroidetes bacterium]|nr:tRNA (5-methylaminomethyl-2-thiouridine)(34)-methyltransferase MnmD [Bacteroidota bacterium]